MTTCKKKGWGGKRKGSGRKKKYVDTTARVRAWRKRQEKK